jgi:hypothetical protein
MGVVQQLGFASRRTKNKNAHGYKYFCPKILENVNPARQGMRTPTVFGLMALV